MPKIGDLQVWWIPQIPMKPFRVPVRNLREADLLLEALANYDLFQLANNVKPDYSNAGGLETFDGVEWSEWDDPATGDDYDGLRLTNPERLTELTKEQ